MKYRQTDSLGSEAAEAPRPFNVESLRWALVYQILSVANVLLSDPKSNPSNQARPKPVHPNQVLVSQEAFNASEIQNAFDNDGLRQVPVPPQDDKLSLFFPDAGHFFRVARVTGQLIGYNRVFDQIPLHQRRNSDRKKL
ncbi:MAG: hypothetical protein WAK20_09530 [Candidatus Acidiferrum sp.]